MNFMEKLQLYFSHVRHLCVGIKLIALDISKVCTPIWNKSTSSLYIPSTASFCLSRILASSWCCDTTG